MVTRRARPRDSIRPGSIARTAARGAAALTVLFGVLELASISTSGRSSDRHRAVIIARDSKTSIVAAGSTRSRGNAWFASLVTTVGCAALAAQLLRADRYARGRRKLEQYSIRLRAPPRFH